MKLIFLCLLASLNTYAQTSTGGLSQLAKPAQPAAATVEHEVDLLNKEFASSPESTLGNYKRIMDEEVVTNPAYFMIGGLKPELSMNGVVDDHAEVEVAREFLWKYLKFSAQSFAGPGLCLQVRAESGCVACETIRTLLHNGLSERYAKRGFAMKVTPVVMSALTAQASIRGEKAFDEYLARVLAQKLEDGTGCDGVLFSEITSGEGKLNVASFAELRSLSGTKVRVKAESSIETGDTSKKFTSDVQIARKLLNHQVVQLFGTAGKSNTLAASTYKSTSGPERFIEVSSLDSFGKLNSFKTAFAEAFPEISLEERFIKQGSVKFAVGTDQSMESILQRLKSSGALESKNLKVEVVKINDATEAVIQLKQ